MGSKQTTLDGGDTHNCHRCGEILPLYKYTRLGYAWYKCHDCKYIMAEYEGLAVAREWIIEQREKENQE